MKTGTISSTDQIVNKKVYDENYERIFGHSGPLKQSEIKGVVKKDRMSVLDNPESSISVMLKDKVMTRMIRDGKANDRGLKREAELIERENSTRPKEMFRTQQQLKLMQLKAELRRSQR